MSNHTSANASAAIPKLVMFKPTTFQEQVNANYQRLMKDPSKPIIDAALYAGGFFIFPPLLLPAIGRSFLRWKDRSSVRITVLPEQAAAWLQLDPSPAEAGLVYARHPYRDNRFISLANFHRVLFDEKAQELTTLLIQLGASKISIQHTHGYR